MKSLAVVLISKNQRWNMPRLIESVLRETAEYECDILLVDSASTDGTAEVAAEFPIRVIRLCPDQVLTAAAGRYVGQANTQGELILFIDGDMELSPGWLASACSLLERRPEVAAISGEIVDVPLDWEMPKSVRLSDPPSSLTTRTVTYCGGAALFRRLVLHEVGSFDPFLYSEEEPELCIRIRAAGHTVLQSAEPIVYHHTEPSAAISTLVGRARRNLYLGAGQNLRKLFGTRLFWRYVKERDHALAPALVLLAGAACCIASLATRNATFSVSWVCGLALLLLADAMRKRSFYKMLRSVVLRLLILQGTVRGALRKPAPPETYPAHFEIVRGESLRISHPPVQASARVTVRIEG